MKFVRNTALQTRRDAWVEINLNAVEANARSLRALLPPNVAMMAILKADAYGHGAVMTIPTLAASGVSMVGVAAVDEALQIREAGLEIPILVIGAVPDWAMPVAIEQDIQLTIFTHRHLSQLQALYDRTGVPVKVHIKVDTGMNRIGIAPQEAAAFIEACQAEPAVEVMGVFSHFACAESPETTARQHDQFQAVIAQLAQIPPLIHLANSAGAVFYPQYRYSLVRLGIGFWGYLGHDTKQVLAEQPQLPLPVLTPAMSLKARIVHLHSVTGPAGISYGHTATVGPNQTRTLATLPLGYADGIPRRLSNQMVGLLRGTPVPQVGNITMDQLMVDVTDVADAAIGDTITLLGQETPNGEALTLSQWAEQLGTIEYELMCALRVRLPKTYTRV